MRTPDSSYISSVLATTEAPCVSIYFPTARTTGTLPGQTAPAPFRALVRRANDLLTAAHTGWVQDIVEQLHKLEADVDFWGQTLDGVVILASPTRFDVFRLPHAVPERVEVGDSFHVKPLLRYAQSAEPFHVLCISPERVALFCGNRYMLTPLAAPGVHLTNDTPEPPSPDTPTLDTHPHHPAAQFFRDVDRQVIHRVSEPSGLPVILVGSEENLTAFRQVTKNRFVTSDAVHGDWMHWNLHKIRRVAWKAFQKHYLNRLVRIREDFGTAEARGKATDNLAEAAKAATIGRVGVLLIDADRTVPGALDLNTGELHPATGSVANDMLDDLAEMGLKSKALVIITPSAQMPTQTGLAAIFRY